MQTMLPEGFPFHQFIPSESSFKGIRYYVLVASYSGKNKYCVCILMLFWCNISSSQVMILTYTIIVETQQDTLKRVQFTRKSR